jgi:outer membrane protein
MNKFKLFLCAAAVTLAANSVNAQAQKAGYFSVEQMVSIMPEIGKIDTALQKYQADSINGEFKSLIEEYNYKDSIVNKTDTTKVPASVLRKHREDLQAIAYQVQNWQQISQQAMQAKQQEYLRPVYARIMDALRAVSKESGYTHVYNTEALLVAPPGDDMLPLVAKKLKITLPNQNQPGGTRPNTGVTKPKQ